jgi:cytochrome b subunit of formate dehydrogenase
MSAQAKPAPAPKPRTYLRFSLVRRVEHLLMLLSFATLGLTGLPQKYASAAISQDFIAALGGIENLRTIHHTAAIVMMLGTIYHIIFVGYKIFVERVRMSMLPGLKDAKDALDAFLYNLGLRKSRPQMGRYTFEEKAEYWAFVWGAMVMGLTGFLMWNPITASKILPGEFIPAAKAAHGGEALLAVLAIIVWHMYGVHLKHFNKAMWTGRLTEDEMLHEHPLELADIKAGAAERPHDPAAVRKRQMIYIPVAAILSAIMLAGVYGFVNTEQTALETVPPQPEAVEVFVPQTPTSLPTPIPSPTPLPPGITPTAIAPSANAEGLTWDSGVAEIFGAKCAMCHGAASPMAGLNLSSYADAMKGSANGPVIVPGDAAASKLVIVQSAGNHPGQLLPEEIANIMAWINAGAPEK